jgi:ABC-2 type transport system ATP-binding protein
MAEEPKPVVEVEDLSYHFGSFKKALNRVTFSVQRQSIHGFVGPNGAGKTTTLKILATLLRVQAGSVRLFGYNISQTHRHVRSRIGFMPDELGVYRQMTVFEYLDFFAAAYGRSLKERDSIISDVLALTDMQSRKDDFLKKLSRGMQQRVSLARVLVHDPDLLLLDEPAAGLDPRARIELMEILKELRRMGKTILISSHILAELGDLCDSVTIIDRGEVKYTGAMEGLVSQEGELSTYILELTEEQPSLEQVLRAMEGVTDVLKEPERPQYEITFRKDNVNTNAILRAVIESGAQVASFRKKLKLLSEAFMTLTKPGVQ